MKPLLPLTLTLAAVLCIRPVASQTTLYTVNGDNAGDWFSTSLEAAGDVDADGAPDFVVGALALNGQAYARALSGRDGAVLHTWPGPPVYSGFAIDVAGAGDIDGDGNADVIVGDPGNAGAGSGAGAIRIYSGATGALMRTVLGSAAEDYFGIAVAGIGDVNSDGVPDQAVGATQNSPLSLGSGYVRAISGADGATIWTVIGVSVGDELGFSLATTGDVDQDGVPDLVAGGRAGNLAWVLAGADGTVIHAFGGGLVPEDFGLTVAGPGDVDGDGVPDVIVGAPGHTTPAGSAVGRAVVHSGATGQLLHTFLGAAAHDVFGIAVDGAGDVNLDGHADLLIGARGADTNGSNAGLCVVMCGRTGRSLFSVVGDSANDSFGNTLTPLGDADADGFLEALVGAFEDDNSGQDSGSVRAIALDYRYAGTGEDVLLATGVNGVATGGPGDDVKSAVVGDVLTTHLSSPNGTFDLAAPILLLDLHLPASPPLPLAPGIHVGPSFLVLYDGLLITTPLGSPVLGSNGFTLPLLVPPGLSGQNALIQGGVVSPAAANGLYATTAAHVIEFM